MRRRARARLGVRQRGVQERAVRGACAARTDPDPARLLAGAQAYRIDAAMSRLIYSMGVSLDGYIAGRGGEIDWSAPDEELHRFRNEQTRELGAHFCGRRLYEEMRYWDTPEASAGGEAERQFAEVWQALPKVVFSSTLR